MKLFPKIHIIFSILKTLAENEPAFGMKQFHRHPMQLNIISVTVFFNDSYREQKTIRPPLSRTDLPGLQDKMAMKGVNN